MSSSSFIAQQRDTRPRLVAARPDLAVPGCLASLTQPPASAPVGAIIDLALLGARGAGKSQLLYLLLRTLRARAPELEGEEAAQQRALVAAALGGSPPPATAGPTHAIASLPVASLLDEIGAGGRAACYWRAGLARSLILSVVAGVAVFGALVLLADGLGALATLLALAFVAAGAGFGWVAARSRWLDLAEIEIALWDPARWPGPLGGRAGGGFASPLAGGGIATIRLHAVPPPAPASGSALRVAAEPPELPAPDEAEPESEPPPGPAELHPVFSQLVHERRRRGAPWRRHVFAPILVVNPIDLGRDPELGDAGRLRRLLPVFAALGGAVPRAMVAISRWNAVESVCRPDSDRRATVQLATAGMGAQGAVAVSRETLRSLCLDAEDGREGDTAIHYLRYDAGWAEPRIDDAAPDGDDPAATSVALTWSDPMSGLEGEARRAFFRFLASLLEPPAAVESVSAVPAGRVGAVE